MSIISGYINAPPGDPQASPIDLESIATVLPNFGTITFSSKANIRHASVILTKNYYPVAYQGGGPRESFIGGIPNKCEAGMCVMLNPCECIALVNAGAAIFSHG